MDKCIRCGKPTSYNGWPNYETWAVKLWLDNDQGLCEYWRETSQWAKAEAPDRDSVKIRGWKVEDVAEALLAERLKEEL